MAHQYCNYEIANIEEAYEIWDKTDANKGYLKKHIAHFNIDIQKQLYFIIVNHYSQELRKSGVKLPDTLLIK